MGVVTGIPLEFQFGTNWADFSKFTGGVIGLTLALEGMFAFFAESAFLGLFLFGEKRLSPRAHFGTALMVFLGSWVSGFFIIATNAFMQHPVGYGQGPDGSLQLQEPLAFVFNPWGLAQYAHNMSASVTTAGFVVAAVGAFYILSGRHTNHARIFLRVGVPAALAGCVLQLWPTGDIQGRMVARHQPVTLAAMEGKFDTSTHAELAIIGQPDVEKRTLQNPVYVPSVLSFLAYGSFGAEVKGLNDFPTQNWPDNVELLYYTYHIMVGLGTMMIVVSLIAGIKLARGTLETSRPLLWILMFSFPFPYIATTAGWMTAELGRQPWLVYGLQRTPNGTSPLVSGGNAAFTSLGFMGMYLVLGVLFLYMVMKELGKGPGEAK
jgi:cytochrome d ubiquinol oxidase subunit I